MALNKGQYEELLKKVYKNESMTPKQLAIIATNPIDKVLSVLMAEEDGILKYKVKWENAGIASVGAIEVD